MGIILIYWNHMTRVRFDAGYFEEYYGATQLAVTAPRPEKSVLLLLRTGC